MSMHVKQWQGQCCFPGGCPLQGLTEADVELPQPATLTMGTGQSRVQLLRSSWGEWNHQPSLWGGTFNKDVYKECTSKTYGFLNWLFQIIILPWCTLHGYGYIQINWLIILPRHQQLKRTINHYQLLQTFAGPQYIAFLNYSQAPSTTIDVIVEFSSLIDQWYRSLSTILNSSIMSLTIL